MNIFLTSRAPKLACSLLAVAAMLASPPAFAEEAAGDDAAEILVVGQRDAPITVVPRGLSVSLGQEHFDAITAINVEDLMKYAPNFFVRKRFAGDDNAVVALRGANSIQSARTIVMVDGFVVSNFLGNRWDFPPKWNVVGPAEVRQFDIVYGPYSARYGGNSMGGVISVTTEAPREIGAYANVQAALMPFREYGFDENFKGYSLEARLNWKQENGPWSARISGRHFENTGQSMTYTLLSPTTGTGAPVEGAFVDPRLTSPVFGAVSPVNVMQDQARLRIGFDAGNGWQIDALGVFWRTAQDLTKPRSWLRNALTGDEIAQGKVSFDGRTWNANGLNFSTMRRTEYLVGLKVAGELAGWDVSANLSRYWIANWDSRTSKDYATGLAKGQGTQSLMNNPGWITFDLGLERQSGAHHLAFGASANRYTTSGDLFTTSNWASAAAPLYASSTFGKTELFGLWAEDAIHLADDWTVTAGLRHEQWRAFDGGMSKAVAGVRRDAFYAPRQGHGWSPKLSLQGDVLPDLALQISLGTAKRFPTVGSSIKGGLMMSPSVLTRRALIPR